MKTLIVGTGIIGTIYGWALSEAGVDVTHYVRKGKTARFEQGVRLDMLDERKGHPANNLTSYALKCVDEVTADGHYELVMVPTRSYQTEEALRTLIPLCPDAVFLVFAANWQGAALIDRLLPRERYLMGYADGGGTIRDGVYWTNLGAEVHLGEVDGSSTEKLERVKALFARADMQADVPANIVHWLWVHIAASTPFWAGFARHGAVQPFLKDRGLVKLCYLACKETLELCERRGVDLSKYQDVAFFKMPFWLFVILFRRVWTHNKSMQRFTAHAMDGLAEAKAIYDEIMRSAKELNVEMPALEALGVYVRDV